MIFNLTTQNYISHNPFYATSSWDRLRGMIGHEFEKSEFDAMCFERCNMIHTCFMSINIDVIFVNRSNIVCGLRESLAPWHPFIRCGNAYFTLELPTGIICKTGTSIGDIVDLQAELSSAVLDKIKTENFMGATNTAIPFVAEEKKR
jgi:uncharacterized membrane protein (UPF0127 family)